MASKALLGILAVGFVLAVSVSAAWVNGPSEDVRPRETTTDLVGNVTQVAKFALDVLGTSGGTPAGAWWSVSGGDQNIEIVTYTTGSDVHEQKRPGQAYYSDITLKGPFAPSRKAVMDWILDTAKGKRERVDMTLSFIDDEGYDLLALDFNVTATGSSVTPHAPGFRTDARMDLRLFEYDAPGPVRLEIQAAGRVVHLSPAAEGAPVLAVRPSVDPPADFPNGRTIVELNVGAVTIGRTPGDQAWAEWFRSQAAKGDDIRVPTLRYMDAKGGEARAYDFHNCYPIRYDVINVDSRSGSSSIKEVLELQVERVEYR